MSIRRMTTTTFAACKGPGKTELSVSTQGTMSCTVTITPEDDDDSLEVCLNRDEVSSWIEALQAMQEHMRGGRRSASSS